MSQTPSWVADARAALEEEGRRNQRRAKQKADALLSVAQRRHDSFGKFMRSRVAKRLTHTGREGVYCSVPLPLAEALRVEADDARIAFSRMLVECAALGLPLWKEYRDSFLYRNAAEEYIPPRVRMILAGAVNPVQSRSNKAREKWQRDVEASLALAQPKKRKPKDPTSAVLGLGAKI